MSRGARARPTRRFRRSTVRIRVDYGVPTGSPRRDLATTLGAGGLFIATDDPLPVGTRLSLRFSIGAHPPHEIGGHVVWQQRGDEGGPGGGMGVAFARGSTARLARELEG